jgi:hypothetical protein
MKIQRPISKRCTKQHFRLETRPIYQVLRRADVGLHHNWDDRVAFWETPNILEGAFPTLFPYGLGGVENRGENSLAAYYTHLLKLGGDRRWQRHIRFLFTAYNTEMRRKASGACVVAAERHSGVTPVTVKNVRAAKHIAERQKVILPADEQATLAQGYALLNRLKPYSAALRGTPMHKERERTRLLAALSSNAISTGKNAAKWRWFQTVTPAMLDYPEIYEAIAAVPYWELDADEAITRRRSASECVKDASEMTEADRRIRLAENPVLAARHFKARIDAFLKHVVHKSISKPLNDVRHTAGFVEAQRDSTLHMHLLHAVHEELAKRVMPGDVVSGDPEKQLRVQYLVAEAVSAELPSRQPGYSDSGVRLTQETSAQLDDDDSGGTNWQPLRSFVPDDERATRRRPKPFVNVSMKKNSAGVEETIIDPGDVVKSIDWVGKEADVRGVCTLKNMHACRRSYCWKYGYNRCRFPRKKYLRSPLPRAVDLKIDEALQKASHRKLLCAAEREHRAREQQRQQQRHQSTSANINT